MLAAKPSSLSDRLNPRVPRPISASGGSGCGSWQDRASFVRTGRRGSRELSGFKLWLAGPADAGGEGGRGGRRHLLRRDRVLGCLEALREGLDAGPRTRPPAGRFRTEGSGCRWRGLHAALQWLGRGRSLRSGKGMACVRSWYG